jgi:cytidylate kinase
MLGESDHLVGALAHLQSYAKGQPVAKQAGPPLTIAISRQAGAGGAAVARAVGGLLGWPVYDHELLTLIAKERGLHEQLLEHLDERYVSWIEEMAASFSAKTNPLEGTYLKELLALLASLGKAGHGVIVGRGAPHLLAVETTLRVRIVAPRAMRIVNMERLLNLSRAEAERWVDKTDKERDYFIQSHFNKDPADPLNYDLLLNSGRYSTGECAAIIVQAARLLEGQVKAVPAGG